MHDDIFTKGMRGEFRGDFSRDTFDPLRHFSRVLMQQGRVQLDADWNEQNSILMHYLRTLVTDLVGPHGVPRTMDGKPGAGFKISSPDSELKLSIAAGHYYVGGILCENALDALDISAQPDFPLTSDELKKQLEPVGDYLVYLDVWERHISYVEDDYIREKALGGPDTATRAKIVWQVKVKNYADLIEDDTSNDFKKNYGSFLKALTVAQERKPGTGRLKARAKKTAEETEPCLTPANARYRGAENQLYRVEIHKPGSAKSGSAQETATFKWSRENGTMTFPISKIDERIITLEHLGRDDRFSLKPNDWVEIIDDDYILRNRADALLQIEDIDPENSQVVVKRPAESSVDSDQNKHPYLRRWDQKDGNSNGVTVFEGEQEQKWFRLEDGVEVQFQSLEIIDEDASDKPVYQTGDYWLIPARIATGDVEWPGSVDAPLPCPPQGVKHHYAPLANVTKKADGISVTEDLRRKLKNNWD